MPELIIKHADALLILKALELAAQHAPAGDLSEIKRARLAHLAEDMNLVVNDNMEFRILVRSPE